MGVVIVSSAGIICNCALLRYLNRSYRTKLDSTPCTVLVIRRGKDKQKKNGNTNVIHTKDNMNVVSYR